MKSRRQFIKTAGIVAGAAALPFYGVSDSLENISISLFPDKGSDEEIFSFVRKQLLIPENRIYLNTGSLGPSPMLVLDAVYAATRQLETNPVSENWGNLGKQMDAVRKKIADFVHAGGEDEILLTRNTTEGLSTITTSLNLKTGDEIITSTQEHEGALVGMEYLEKTKGVVLKKISIPMPTKSVDEVIETIKAQITPKTRLIILSHVNTVTGLIMPFAEIAKLTKPKGIALVADGAQAAGLIKVDVAALGVDAYAASGHKWLLGPKETGFLYIKKDFQPKLQGLFLFSGFNAYSASSGTRNAASFIGLGAAIDLHTQIGVERIRKRCLETRNYCLAQLKTLTGLKINSPEADELSSGMVSFLLDKAINKDVYNKLKEQDIIVKLLSGSNSLRISCHIFVTTKDIDKCIEALKPLL